MNFYLTFGQKSPAKNGYILVIADNIEGARRLVQLAHGDQWANLYEEKSDWDPSYFPAGQLGVLK